MLIASLNWGFGHVSRDIGLIRTLLENENTIFFAGSPEQIAVVKQYFPELQFCSLPAYPFSFGGKGMFARDLFFSISKLYKHLKLENKLAKKLVKSYRIDVLISDHRYGFRSPDCISIFLTHQVNLPLNLIQQPFQLLHKALMKAFDLVWILDDANNSLAGKLSSVKSKNQFLIGHFSRFEPVNDLPKSKHQVLIVSGPEPYNQQFLDLWIKGDNKQTKTYIVAPKTVKVKLNTTVYEHLPNDNWIVCDEVIRSACKVISRSGYSTLMDLKMLNSEFELHPTKGQKEQEYLFKLHGDKKTIK